MRLRKTDILVFIISFCCGYIFCNRSWQKQGNLFVRYNTQERSTIDIRENVSVVVFIPTPLQNVERRRLVNAQFYKENWKRNEVVLLWIIGTKQGDYLEQELDISSIYQEYGVLSNSIIAAPCRDYGDEFNNPNGTSATTCKFYEAMKYINRNFNSKYVWRGADDAYLNLRLFFRLIPSLPYQTAWLGQLKDSKRSWDLELSKQPKLRELFGIDKFSYHFMLGMGFAFTSDIVTLIASWNIQPHLTWCEDVLVGHWLHIFKIQKINRPDLFINRAGSSANKWPLDGTYGNLTVLIVHYIEEEDWDNIDDAGNIYIACPKNGHC